VILDSAWDYIHKAREVWPPDLEKILEYYEKAEKINPDYYLIYKDKARLFYMLKKYEKCIENYELWEKAFPEDKWRISKEKNFRLENSLYNIYPWDKHYEYFEREKKINIKNSYNFDEESKKMKNLSIKKEKLVSDSTYEIEQTKKELEKLKAELKKKKVPSKKEEKKKKVLTDVTFNEFYRHFSFGQIRKAIHFKEKLKSDTTDEIEQTKKVLENLKAELKQKKAPSKKEEKKKVGNKILKSTISLTPCPSCNLTPKNYMQAIEFFGLRYNGTRRQSYCSLCRGKDTKSKQNNNNDLQNENSQPNIREQCMDVIKYKRKRIDLNLAREMHLEYLKLNSIAKICEKHPGINEDKIRRHLQTPLRLPKDLKENAFLLVSDPEASMAIAMYATDYFYWDNNVNDEKKVLQLVLQIQKGFEENNDLRLLLMGKKN